MDGEKITIENKEIPDSLKKTQGGARPGAGRKKGSMSLKTKEKKIKEEYIRNRVISGLEGLVNAQMNLAKGVTLLFKIIETKDKNGRVIGKTKPILVTDQNEIERFLADDIDDEDTYYFITVKEPDNKALDSLLDRTFGRARQNIGLDGGKDGSPISLVQVLKKAGNK